MVAACIKTEKTTLSIRNDCNLDKRPTKWTIPGLRYTQNQPHGWKLYGKHEKIRTDHMPRAKSRLTVACGSVVVNLLIICKLAQ